MSETTPDPAVVGTDRVELTEDERASLNCDCVKYDGSHYDTCFVPAVESIVAARLQALTAERDELDRQAVAEHDRAEGWRKKQVEAVGEVRRLLGVTNEYMAERDAARAELAATNTRNRELEREIDERDKAHEGIVATITAAARADTRTAKSDAAKVQMLAERVDALRLSRDKHRNRAAAANARCAELEEEIMAHQVGDGYTKGYEHGTLTTAKFKAERDALQETLDRVTALAAEQVDEMGVPYPWAKLLRAALTPEGTE